MVTDKYPQATVENKPKKIPVLTKRERRKKIIFLICALIVINLFIWGSFYFTFYKAANVREVVNDLEKSSNVSPVPTPFPFQEMTIPALKARNYKSSIKDKSVLSQNDNYTSYLATYNSDGNKINGLLTIPAGVVPSGGWPAIIFVHGYIPPSLYTTTGNYSIYVDYLARNGYVVFKIDLRGHGASEGESSGGYYGSDYVIDTLNARAALSSTDFVNKNKIGLWGHSMAGNVITRALAARGDIPAIVIWSGAVYTYSDLQKYGIMDDSYRPPLDANKNLTRRQQLIKLYGAFDPKSDFWKLVPFTNYLGDVKGAISINHSVDDNVVNIGYSRDLNNLLNKTSIPHELNEYASGGHNINDGNFSFAMQNTVNFFDKYLKSK